LKASVDKSLHICWALWVYLDNLSTSDFLSRICAFDVHKLTKRLSES
jgi:hypothetical protein